MGEGGASKKQRTGRGRGQVFLHHVAGARWWSFLARDDDDDEEMRLIHGVVFRPDEYFRPTSSCVGGASSSADACLSWPGPRRAAGEGSRGDVHGHLEVGGGGVWGEG